jgi:hypothetical protein
MSHDELIKGIMLLEQKYKYPEPVATMNRRISFSQDAFWRRFDKNPQSVLTVLTRKKVPGGTACGIECNHGFGCVTANRLLLRNADSELSAPPRSLKGFRVIGVIRGSQAFIRSIRVLFALFVIQNRCNQCNPWFQKVFLCVLRVSAVQGFHL